MQIIITTLMESYPIVLMHGIGQYKEGVEQIEQWIQEKYPTTHVLNCEVGNGKFDSIFWTVKDQVEDLSACINNDKKLKDGFVAVGFSQGGYLLRHYIQMYNHVRAPAKRFIGISNPLGGFFCGVIEGCYGIGVLPDLLQTLEPALIYSHFIQNLIGAVNYWRDPYALEMYEESALDLPFLDNIRDYDETRKQNFMSVDNYILFGSPKDGAITPWKSAFFGQFGADDSEILNYWERKDFNADNFGLKSMHEQNRIKTFETNFEHSQYHQPIAREYMFEMVLPWMELQK